MGIARRCVDPDRLTALARHGQRHPADSSSKGFPLISARLAVGAGALVADESLGPLCGALLGLTSIAKPSEHCRPSEIKTKVHQSVLCAPPTTAQLYSYLIP